MSYLIIYNYLLNCLTGRHKHARRSCESTQRHGGASWRPLVNQHILQNALSCNIHIFIHHNMMESTKQK